MNNKYIRESLLTVRDLIDNLINKMNVDESLDDMLETVNEPKKNPFDGIIDESYKPQPLEIHKFKILEVIPTTLTDEGKAVRIRFVYGKSIEQVISLHNFTDKTEDNCYEIHIIAEWKDDNTDALYYHDDIEKKYSNLKNYDVLINDGTFERKYQEQKLENLKYEIGNCNCDSTMSERIDELFEIIDELKNKLNVLENN